MVPEGGLLARFERLAAKIYLIFFTHLHHSQTKHSFEKNLRGHVPSQQFSPQRNRRKISAKKISKKSPANPVEKKPLRHLTSPSPATSTPTVVARRYPAPKPLLR